MGLWRVQIGFVAVTLRSLGVVKLPSTGAVEQALADQLDDLCSLSRTHTVKGENQLLSLAL